MTCTTKTTKAIHLNLPLELHAVITELCEATGQRPARLITDVLMHSEPQFKRLLKAALLAKTAPKAAVGALQEMMDSLLAEAGMAQEDVRQLDLLNA